MGKYDSLLGKVAQVWEKGCEDAVGRYLIHECNDTFLIMGLLEGAWSNEEGDETEYWVESLYTLVIPWVNIQEMYLWDEDQDNVLPRSKAIKMDGSSG